MIIRKVKENLFTLSVILTGVAFLDFVFHRPEEVEKFIYKNFPIEKLKKTREIELPQVKKLDVYLKVVGERIIFKTLAQKEEPVTTGIINPQDYEFQGLVGLDKPYVAVFKKSTQEQFLVSEGGTIDGIRIKKIAQDYIIIEYYGEERKVLFVPK
ncbi:MAG: hypothetical protein NC898_04480 [Candidatus Omnitrophica bacterium]|nr:hypothetical protein [Candidatus Omnitrophota bacterium]MCM8793703.1 hypothetical protein [Candidatus Omnitrophota bacterium]